MLAEVFGRGHARYGYSMERLEMGLRGDPAIAPFNPAEKRLSGSGFVLLIAM